MKTLRVITIGMFVFISIYLVPISQATTPAQLRQDCGAGKLLFFQNHGGTHEIWQLTFPGDNAPTPSVILEDGISATTPAWSSVTRQIAFTGTDAFGYQDVYIVSVDASGNIQSTITSSDSDHFDAESRERQPVWSPDGRRLAFEADSGGANFDIWIMEIEGPELWNLTEDKPDTNEFSPDWSPDGTRIVYVSDESEFDQIQIRNVDPANPAPETLLEGNPLDMFSPAWSPGGDWIAFTQRESTGSKIYLINLADRQPRRLTSIPDDILGKEAWPAWSPDGRYLTFTAAYSDGARLSSFDLYTVRVFNDAMDTLFVPVDPAACRIAHGTLGTSDEFGPIWTLD